MAEETWQRRELSILEAVGQSAEAGASHLGHVEVTDLTGLDTAVVKRSLNMLWRNGYIEAVDASGAADPLGTPTLIIYGLTERGLRATGQWPSEGGFESLMQHLEQRLETAADPEERTRLKKLLDGFAGAGSDVGASVLTAWVKGQLGI